MTTRTRDTSIEVRRVRQADQGEVLSLLNCSLNGGPTGTWTQEFLDWKHRDSPFGVSPGLVAIDGDAIVGVRLFLRWDLARDGQRVRAVRAVDTATHPDYQRRGIFRRLTLTLLEQLDKEGTVDLVFNTPNADSRPGYLRMGWQEVGRLPIRISPVRPVRFLWGARAASHANATGNATAVFASPAVDSGGPSTLPSAASILADEQQVADLAARAAAPMGWHTPVSVAYLRWRYAMPPGLTYRCVVVRRRDEVVGLGFGRTRSRAGLTEFTLGDVLVAAGDHRAAWQVLRAARRSGVDHVAVHAARGSEIAKVASAAGYLTVPGSGIGLVANPRQNAPTGMLDPTSWRLTLGDLEVF